MKILNEPTYKKFIVDEIKRFDDRNGGFSRGITDPTFTSWKSIKERMLIKTKESKGGRTLEDLALSLACRTIDYTIRSSLYCREEDEILERLKMSDNDDQPPLLSKVVKDPQDMSRKIKQVARFLGANEAGICELNPLWVYSHWGHFNALLTGAAKAGDSIHLPDDYKYGVVMIHAMDYEMSLRTPALNPSIDLGYSKMAFVAPSLASFIRLLGYKAISAGNEIAISIPMAIDAGLGELGRNGLLITEKYGPRVRISKVLTNLPLYPDKPIDIGLEKFCEHCKKCAHLCPSSAISRDEMSETPWNKSNSTGVKRWLVNAEKCLGFWAKNSADCSICIRTCPWNKPNTLFHKGVRQVAENFGSLTPLMVWFDNFLGYGMQKIRGL